MWWGRPDLNRRPLPKNRAKQPFTGFFMTAPEIRHSPRGVSKPVCVCFLEPIVIPALGLSGFISLCVISCFMLAPRL